jgi:hypothetical protein
MIVRVHGSDYNANTLFINYPTSNHAVLGLFHGKKGLLLLLRRNVTKRKQCRSLQPKFSGPAANDRCISRKILRIGQCIN